MPAAPCARLEPGIERFAGGSLRIECEQLDDFVAVQSAAEQGFGAVPRRIRRQRADARPRPVPGAGVVAAPQHVVSRVGERRGAAHRERDVGIPLTRGYARGVDMQEQAQLAPDECQDRGAATAREGLRAVTSQAQQGRGEAATQSVEPGLNR